jgi:hypothetical protein
MMGERSVMQQLLFYGFSLERHVPTDHLLRKIDRFLDLSDLRAQLAPFYSDVGRRSIDPELMIRMLLVGIVLAFAPNAGCARKCTSIWLIAGSVDWVWTATFPTTRLSPRTVMDAFARAICCGAFSRPWWCAA